MRRVHDHVIDKLYEISFLIHFHLFKLNQKRDFEQFESVPKAGFVQIDVMWSFISKREIRVDQKRDGMHMRHGTTSSNFWTDRELNHRILLYENSNGNSATEPFQLNRIFQFLVKYQIFIHIFISIYIKIK